MKLLIVRIGALGDVLHALPAVAALHREQPDWQIDWVVDARWAPLLVAIDATVPGPIVHRAHLAHTRIWTRKPFSSSTLRTLSVLRRSIRRDRYDLTVDMQGTLRSSLIARFGRAPIAGYADPRERAAAWFYRRKLPRQGIHVVQQGAALLGQAVGIPLEPRRIALPTVVWADDWAADQNTSGGLCILSPDSGWSAKRWPAARYAALAQELRTRGFDPVVNAIHADDPLANQVAQLSQGAARVVVSNITGLIALTRRSVLAVGGDSGPVHLAAALGVPTVALFGPTHPARNAPWGPAPVRVVRDPASVISYKHVDTPDPGLARITVPQVMAAVAEVLRPPQS